MGTLPEVLAQLSSLPPEFHGVAPILFPAATDQRETFGRGKFLSRMVHGGHVHEGL